MGMIQLHNMARTSKGSVGEHPLPGLPGGRQAKAR